jgi:hypothetical protein
MLSGEMSLALKATLWWTKSRPIRQAEKTDLNDKDMMNGYINSNQIQQTAISDTGSMLMLAINTVDETCSSTTGNARKLHPGHDALIKKDINA